ncbi:MAG: polysaccharide deacetylase family protein [Acidobacteriota bacterium]|nr:polysaccharide deacetylase family protein [Acidobacteriota bacterium]
MQSQLNSSSYGRPVRPGRSVPGSFVISLDFELRWGTRDRSKPASAPQLLNSRDVVCRLLDLFHASHISATWATVGFLFAESRDELSHFLPDLLPTYEQTHLNPYAEKIGSDEQDDPLHFAPSLVRKIQECPLQEIGTHTFSHYYCLEPGQTAAQFNADLQSACRIAEAHGIEIRSIVFPRNQVSPAILPFLSQNGITCFRGTARSWLHEASSFARQRLPHKRALRLADAYVPITGSDVVDSPVEVADNLYELYASRYFRPYTSGLATLAGLALHRIKQSMELAARTGRVYHIWFHPEDFGLYPNENLSLFAEVLKHYTELRDRYGMQSLSMAGLTEAAAQIDSQTASSPFLALSA